MLSVRAPVGLLSGDKRVWLNRRVVNFVWKPGFLSTCRLQACIA